MEKLTVIQLESAIHSKIDLQTGKCLENSPVYVELVTAEEYGLGMA